MLRQLADEALVLEPDAVRALASYRPKSDDFDFDQFLIGLSLPSPPPSRDAWGDWTDDRTERKVPAKSLEDTIEEQREQILKFMELIGQPYYTAGPHVINVTVLWNAPIDGWVGVADEAVEFLVPLASRLRHLGIVGAASARMSSALTHLQAGTTRAL